jgi:thioredoxin reductase (NADPH)
MVMYDIIVVGGGPAGLSAAIYASRYNLKSLLVSRQTGGQMNDADKICNYPGFLEISGFDLAEKFKDQAEKLGVEIKEAQVVSIEKQREVFSVETGDNKEFKTKSVILSLGKARRKLNIKGEDRFLGKGVSYCATCDGPLYKDKTVAVIGGSDAATTAALLLSRHAKKVYIIYRKDKLRGMPSWISMVKKTENIEVIYNAKVTEVKGDNFVSSITVEGPDGRREMEIGGVFIEVGGVPQTSLAKETGVGLDKSNHIIVKPDQSTNVKGVFAAGDVTTGSDNFQQVVTAAAEGAIAARSAYRYVTGDER